jgi:cytochrome b pre-mRNA-processing protein 3
MSRLYGAIVAQARQPAFYRSYGVSDSLDGRFEMILLHTVLAVRRLRRAGRSGEDYGQILFDHFCSDMDGSLREMGIGDLTVPKQMKKVGAAFYQRQAGYDAALGLADDDRLIGEVGQHFPSLPPLGAGAMAAYIRRVAERLDEQPADALFDGQIAFPDPENGSAAA